MKESEFVAEKLKSCKRKFLGIQDKICGWKIMSEDPASATFAYHNPPLFMQAGGVVVIVIRTTSLPSHKYIR